MSELIKSNPLLEGRQSENLPSFMKSDTGEGMEELGKVIVPPRLKVIQKQSEDRFLEKFDMGDVVMMPLMERFAAVKKNEAGKPTDEGEAFTFVPVFFFVEFLQINPLNTKGSLPMIRQRTFDENSELARKCRNPDQWEEDCPESDKPLRNCEVLNYIVMPLDGPFVGMECIMSFAKGEHRAGSSLAALLKMRTGAPLYGCKFQGFSHLRTHNPQGQWYGIDCVNPPEKIGGWVDDERLYEFLRSKYREYREAYDSRLLRPEYDDVDADAEATVSDSKDREF